MLNFTYKGETYSWEEWQKEYKEFVEGLELPNDFLNYVTLWNFLIAKDRNYCMAIDRLEALYHLIATARISLINSFRKFYDSNIVMPQGSYISQLAMRSHYLRNSIVWYNSCEDYVYQIIWCAFELHNIEIDNPKAYKKILKKYSYDKMKAKLEKVDSAEAEELLGLINKYRDDEDVKYLRSSLANNLKHHANLEFKGLSVGKPAGYMETDLDGNITFDANWLSSDLIDIDETIDRLKRTHTLLIKFVRDVVDFIDFEDATRGENNKLLWEVIKPKSSYRKINLN